MNKRAVGKHRAGWQAWYFPESRICYKTCEEPIHDDCCLVMGAMVALHWRYHMDCFLAWTAVRGF